VKTLRGITWNHDRGLAPMIATAAQFAETHPEVHIEWTVRSLQGFADHSIQQLSEQFDMIVLDHPFMGTAAKIGCLAPLDRYVSPDLLRTLQSESVGASHLSYFYDGHQWALAIDAAAHVAGYRPDLLEKAGAKVPDTWDEVFELSRIRPGFVTTPLLPVDSSCAFMSLCANAGEPAFSGDPKRVVGERTGELALQTLKQLSEAAPKDALGWNPIALWERMSTTDEIAYCPLAFGYSNYARPGYRKSLLQFTRIPSRGPWGASGAILGGAGLAISARSKELQTAMEYAQWVAGAECQKSIYVTSGGQPANKKAWTDPHVNAITSHFFEDTLQTLESSFLRPRFPGFVEFQAEISTILSDFLHGRESSTLTLRSLDACYSKWRP